MNIKKIFSTFDSKFFVFSFIDLTHDRLSNILKNQNKYMPSVYDLKPKFQKLLSPILEILYKLKITPNQITLLALLLSLVCGLCLYFFRSQKEVLFLIPIVLFLRMALNALDGMMARNYNLSSKLGEILNELGDVLSDTFIYLPLLFLFNKSSLILLIFIFVFLAALTEFCGILCKSMVSIRSYQGPMGKSDRAFFIGLLSLLLYFFPLIQTYLEIIFGLAILLLTITCMNRLKTIFS